MTSRPQAVPRPCSITLRRTSWLIITATAALLAACSSTPHKREPTFKASHSELAALPARAPSAANAQVANDVLFRAMALVGTPYKWGGNTPQAGFDCSGLVDYIYRNAADIALPHSSRAMSDLGQKVKRMKELASGDLVFFGGRSGISHVGVYVGQGRFVHAPNSGGTVRLDDIDGPYWRDHFEFGKRLLD
jgi:cell wall-associated NlpC family hydrolase